MNPVNELMDYLQLYRQVIISGGVSSNLQKIGILEEEINSFMEMANQGIDLSSFDFKKLKKDLAAVFHPDVFMGKNEFIEDPGQLIGHAFGALDSILKNQKDGIPFSFQVAPDGEATSPYDRDYSSYQERPFREDPIYGEDRYQRTYQEPYQRTYQDSYQEPYYSVSQFFLDKFQFYFRNIPSNVNDYSNLKKRFEILIDKLSYRIKVLDKSIELATYEEIGQRRTWQMSLEDSNIEKEFQAQLYSLQEEGEKRKKAHASAKNVRNARFQELLPEINQEYWVWEGEAKAAWTRYNDLNSKYSAQCYGQGSFFPPEKMGDVYNELQRMYQENQSRFGNPRMVFKEISKQICNGDKLFVAQEKLVEKRFQDIQKAEQRCQQFLENKEKEKERIKAEINFNQSLRNKKLNLELNHQKKKKQSLENRLQNNRQRLDTLTRDYGHIYGQEGRRFS